MNSETRIVTRDGQRVDLTPSEFGLLQTLIARPGRVFTRMELLDSVQAAHQYAYNGFGQHVQQTFGGQPGRWQVLASPTGTQQQQNPSNAWVSLVQDGLGSVRGVANATNSILEARHYDPYGQPHGSYDDTPFGFTGEPTDGNGLVYLRARYYSPALGVFPSLDPLDGSFEQPLTLNQYAYAQGNVANRIDPTGMQSPDECQTNPAACLDVKYPPFGNLVLNATIRLDGSSTNKVIPITTAWSAHELGVAGRVGLTTNNALPLRFYLGMESALPAGYTKAISMVAPGGYSYWLAAREGQSVAEIARALGSLVYVEGSPTILGDLPSEVVWHQPAMENRPFSSKVLTQGLFDSSRLSVAQPSTNTNPAEEPPCLALPATQTATPAPKTCNPQRVQQWMLTLPQHQENQPGEDFDYQRRVAGNIIYTVSGGGEDIHPDGIRAQDCYLLEAKFVGNPEESPFVLDSRARSNPRRNDIFRRFVDPRQDGEFRRYSQVLADPNTPVLGLEVITNEARSVSYWQQWITANAVPNPRITVAP